MNNLKSNFLEKIQFWKKKKTYLDILSNEFDVYYKDRKNNPYKDKINKKWIINGLEREFSRVICGTSFDCYNENTGSQERIRVSLFDDIIYNETTKILLDLNKYYDILSPEKKQVD